VCVTLEPIKSLYKAATAYKHNNTGSGAELQPPEANGGLGAEPPMLSQYLQRN